MKRIIYADHAATTPLSTKAQLAMQPYYESEFYNPSTKYAAAYRVRKAVEQAREAIAACIGANAGEIYFTSGGTESDNWAIKGTAFLYPGQRKRIITTNIEHHAVLNSCAFLEKVGYDVTYLPVNMQGLVDPLQLEKGITEKTILISIMSANNEIGSIEPIEKCATIAHAHNLLFHTDAVQAIGHIPMDVNKLGIDMLSASAHKFGGPKGVGFLYARSGVHLESLLSGGAQEHGARAGTENVAGIVGMAAALQESVEALERETQRLLTLRHTLCTTLLNENIDFVMNGSKNVLPGTISLSFKNMDGELLLHRLDLMGIQVATGSACDSNETRLSHVVSALQLPKEYAPGTIRISLGVENTAEDMVCIAQAIQRICGK